MKVLLSQLEVDKLVYVLLKTKTENMEELTQEQVDELVEVLLETRTKSYNPCTLLDNPEVYDYFALQLVKESARRVS